MNVTIIANNISWDFQSTLPKLAEWFKTYSHNRLEAAFDVKQTDFENIPISPFNGMQAIDVGWYRKNITPLATGQISVFLVNPEQYQNNYSTWGFMTWADVGKSVRCEVSVYDDPNFPEAHIAVHRIFHEICHALQFLTGQPDRTHELLLQNPPQRQALMDYIDYEKLEAALKTINTESSMTNQSKVVKSKNSETVWICQPVPDMDYLEKKANLEGFTIPANIPNSDAL